MIAAGHICSEWLQEKADFILSFLDRIVKILMISKNSNRHVLRQTSKQIDFITSHFIENSKTYKMLKVTIS